MAKEDGVAQFTLTDDQIHHFATAYDDHFQRLLSQAGDLVAEHVDSDDADEIAISIGQLRALHGAITAMYKTIRQSPAVQGMQVPAMTQGLSILGGDTGSNCDYNPFKPGGVNWLQ